MSSVVMLILNVMGKDKNFWMNYQKKRQKNKGEQPLMVLTLIPLGLGFVP